MIYYKLTLKSNNNKYEFHFLLDFKLFFTLYISINIYMKNENPDVNGTTLLL